MITVINMLIDSVCEERQSILRDHYGDFHVMIHDVQSEDLHEILTDAKTDGYGVLIHSGNYEINGTKNIGTVG